VPHRKSPLGGPPNPPEGEHGRRGIFRQGEQDSSEWMPLGHHRSSRKCDPDQPIQKRAICRDSSAFLQRKNMQEFAANGMLLIQMIRSIFGKISGGPKACIGVPSSGDQSALCAHCLFFEGLLFSPTSREKSQQVLSLDKVQRGAQKDQEGSKGYGHRRHRVKRVL